MHHSLVGIVAGAQIQLRLLQHAAAVVCAIVHIDDLHTGIEQVNGRQHAVAVQAIGVEFVRLKVRGGDKPNAVDLHGHQQTVQDHGVGDISNMKFIETNQLETLGHASAQFIQRVDRALQFMQFTVHLSHEFVKMQAGFTLNGNGLVKAIHQKTFSPAYTAEQINALRNIRVVDEFFDGVGTFELVAGPCLGAIVQRLDSSQLRWVAVKAPRF